MFIVGLLLFFAATYIGIYIKTVVSYKFQMKSASSNYQIRAAIPVSFYGFCDGLSGPGDDMDVNYQQFYTYDDDRNGCAATQGGGWWYDTGCAYGNLNGFVPKWPVKGTLYTLNVSRLLLARKH